MPKIFISYRRDDTGDQVIHIRDRLQPVFGEKNVFLDIDVHSGTKWKDNLRNELEKSDIVLVIIGQKWLTITGNDGNPRLFTDGDWVREEVETAIRENKKIIPVLMGEAPEPSTTELPHSIQKLTDYQFQSLRGGHDYSRDMEDLITAIQNHFPDEVATPPQKMSQASERRYSVGFESQVGKLPCSATVSVSVAVLIFFILGSSILLTNQVTTTTSTQEVALAGTETAKVLSPSSTQTLTPDPTIKNTSIPVLMKTKAPSNTPKPPNTPINIHKPTSTPKSTNTPINIHKPTSTPKSTSTTTNTPASGSECGADVSRGQCRRTQVALTEANEACLLFITALENVEVLSSPEAGAEVRDLLETGVSRAVRDRLTNSSGLWYRVSTGWILANSTNILEICPTATTVQGSSNYTQSAVTSPAQNFETYSITIENNTSCTLNGSLGRVSFTVEAGGKQIIQVKAGSQTLQGSGSCGAVGPTNYNITGDARITIEGE